MKRGQITLFIIMGIMILLAFGVVNYGKNVAKLLNLQMDIESGSELSYTSLDIKNYIQECVEQTAIQSITSLGLHGGTLKERDKGERIGLSFVNYGYFIGENTLPPIKMMEDELSNYMNEALDICLNDFFKFEDKIKISSQKTDTRVEIRENVLFNVNKTFKVIDKETTITSNEFYVEIPVRLEYMHNLSNIIIDEEIRDAGWLPYDLMTKFDVNIAVYPYKEDVIIFSLIDNKSILNGQYFEFQFANKFDPNYQDPLLDKAEKLLPKIIRG
ncbi:hypothetical protein HYX15_00255 [Candidatus Woesearchaeota archaeon]|nr:hypothetical protein [Candidatus Woesearchaeota archaeon]